MKFAIIDIYNNFKSTSEFEMPISKGHWSFYIEMTISKRHDDFKSSMTISKTSWRFEIVIYDFKSSLEIVSYDFKNVMTISNRKLRFQKRHDDFKSSMTIWNRQWRFEKDTTIMWQNKGCVLYCGRSRSTYPLQMGTSGGWNWTGWA